MTVIFAEVAFEKLAKARTVERIEERVYLQIQLVVQAKCKSGRFFEYRSRSG